MGKLAVVVSGLLLCASASASLAQAAVVANTFNAGDTFAEGGSAILGISFGSIQTPAHVFTVTGGDYELNSLAIAANAYTGTNSMVLSIMTDSGGLPGTVLESFPLTNLSTSPPYNTQIVTVNSALRPVLAEGSSYWIALAAGDPGTNGYWCTGGPDVRAAYNHGSGWSLSSFTEPGGAYRVTGTPVPEPTAAAVVGAVAGVISLRRRTRC